MPIKCDSWHDTSSQDRGSNLPALTDLAPPRILHYKAIGCRAPIVSRKCSVNCVRLPNGGMVGESLEIGRVMEINWQLYFLERYRCVIVWGPLIL